MSEKIDRTTENHSTADATLSKRKASHLQQSWVMHAGMLMIADAGILVLAYFLGLFFRFECSRVKMWRKSSASVALQLRSMNAILQKTSTSFASSL